jgi:hypothetical protein
MASSSDIITWASTYKFGVWEIENIQASAVIIT